MYTVCFFVFCFPTALYTGEKEKSTKEKFLLILLRKLVAGFEPQRVFLERPPKERVTCKVAYYQSKCFNLRNCPVSQCRLFDVMLQVLVPCRNVCLELMSILIYIILIYISVYNDQYEAGKGVN